MTLTSTLTKLQFAGNDSTTVFAVSFIFYTDAELRVILTVDSTGVETVQTLTTDYTLTGGTGSTGTLTMIVAPATGETLTIKSNIEDKQQTSLPFGGEFPSTIVERRLDIITRLVQQHSEELARIVTFPETSAFAGVTFPDPSALLLMRWNAAGTDLENVDVATLDAATGVDPADTNATKDKLVSNLLAKGWEDSLNLAPFVRESQFTNSSVRVKNSSGTMVSVALAASTFLARKASGNVSAVSQSEAITILGISSGATNNSKASQAEMETATDDVKFVTPLRAKNHPSAAKAWCEFEVSGGTVTLNDNLNISSVADDGVGKYTLNFTSNFSSSLYAAAFGLRSNDSNGGINLEEEEAAADVVRTSSALAIQGHDASTTYFDVEVGSVVLMGDL